MRLGWFRPVHCKSMSAQETRTLLTARKLCNRSFVTSRQPARDPARLWSQVGKTTERQFAGRIEELVAGHPQLQVIAKALLRASGAAERIRSFREASAQDGPIRPADTAVMSTRQSARSWR